MSCGHHPKSEGPSHLLDSAISDPKVRQKLARGAKVDRQHDVPYTGGISNDGRTVYIDRHLPTSLKIGRLSINPVPYLQVHERTEHALMTVLGMKYQQAHKLATTAEHRRLRHNGIDPAAYEAALKPYIKADDVEKLKKVPANLFMGPYRDEHDTALEKRMAEAR
jgi:hypothetical protein